MNHCKCDKCLYQRSNYLWRRQFLSIKWMVRLMKGSPADDVHMSVVKAAHVRSPLTVFFFHMGYLFTSDIFDRQVDHRKYTD